MNKINEVLNELTDAELQVAVHELHTLATSGVLSGVVVRVLSNRLQSELNISGHDARTITENSIYRLAAYRWAGIKESSDERENG